MATGHFPYWGANRTRSTLFHAITDYDTARGGTYVVTACGRHIQGWDYYVAHPDQLSPERVRREVCGSCRKTVPLTARLPFDDR